jgi:hypothetical protein
MLRKFPSRGREKNLANDKIEADHRPGGSLRVSTSDVRDNDERGGTLRGSVS